MRGEVLYSKFVVEISLLTRLTSHILKVLHTADWHLGQKFYHRSRDEEHRLMLDWLLQLIENQKVECLVVAGDIFDVRNPPNTAEAIYYRFLARLLATGCRHVVIIGGNHDLPAKLNAPRRLLEALQIHVVGAAEENPGKELKFLKNEAGEVEMLVAAVPFLSTRDLEAAAPGESAADRILRIQNGIAAHYKAVGKLCEPAKTDGIPILATGHLYARGATVARQKEQQNIYLGNLENITADRFPAVFDYVALGHIHRAQAVGGLAHIRYSGSPNPLSFSELEDKKSITILEFAPKKGLTKWEEIPVPTFRKLIRLRGSLESIFQKMEKINLETTPGELAPWLEIVVENDREIPLLDTRIRDFAAPFRLEILLTRLERTGRPATENTPSETILSLAELTPRDVFLKKLATQKFDETEFAALEITFAELEEWVECHQ